MQRKYENHRNHYTNRKQQNNKCHTLKKPLAKRIAGRCRMALCRIYQFSKMNKELDKIKLWAILHGETIQSIISAKNCYKYCHFRPLTCRARCKRVTWALIIKNKILKIKLTKDHKSDKEYKKFLDDGEKYWTCIEFIYHPKK